MNLFDRMLERSNQVRPTDQQLAIARKLGLNVAPGMSMDDVSRLISESKSCSAPTREQLARASELGLVINPDMSTQDVRFLIDRADTSGMFTQYQLAEARALGVSVRDEMSYAEVAALIRQAEISNPPLEKQLELCEKIGLPIKPGMNRGQLERLLEYASKNPKYTDKFNAFDPARLAALDRKQREQFGDALVDNLCRWRERVDHAHYLIEYRKDRDIMVDVSVIESVEIHQAPKPHIQVGLALPLVVQDEQNNDYLEWGKDELLPVKSFLHITRLKSKLGPGDLKDYWRLVAYGQNRSKVRNHESDGQRE